MHQPLAARTWPSVANPAPVQHASALFSRGGFRLWEPRVLFADFLIPVTIET